MTPYPIGILFNVQRYSVHDGQGIRTLVFLKGCPLRCHWCSNPESQSFRPELAYNPAKCIGCGSCLPHAASGIMAREEDGVMRFTPGKATLQDLSCAEACPAKALIRYGDEENAAHLLDRVEQDNVFYARSGGGLTLSGGEPLAQPAFCLSVLEEARRRRVRTAMETSGYAETGFCLQAFGLLDELFYDIKIFNPKKHKNATGVDNARILRNISAARQRYPGLPLTIRTPVVPGVNDSAEEISAIARFVRDELPGARYELLEYHRFGRPKYAFLGRPFPLDNADLAPGVFAGLQRMAADIVPCV